MLTFLTQFRLGYPLLGLTDGAGQSTDSEDRPLSTQVLSVVTTDLIVYQVRQGCVFDVSVALAFQSCVCRGRLPYQH